MADSVMSTKKIVVREHLFRTAAETGSGPRLVGSKCGACGEVVFPAMAFCPNCGAGGVTELLIGPRGKLYSYTVIYQPGPVGYKGPVPYGVVKVEMPEGLRITGYATENNPAKFQPGMEMEIIIDKFFDDADGSEIIGFKFKPI
jgi:uncharacterized protein